MVDQLPMLALASRQLVAEHEVAPRDLRCGAAATTDNVFGPRQVACVRSVGHVELHVSIPRPAFPQVGHFWVYAWR